MIIPQTLVLILGVWGSLLRSKDRDVGYFWKYTSADKYFSEFKVSTFSSEKRKALGELNLALLKNTKSVINLEHVYVSNIVMNGKLRN